MRKKLFATAVVMVSASVLLGCTELFLPLNDKVVSLFAVPGVTPPVTGAIPVMSLVASEYTGSISWNPVVSGAFDPNTIYTANIVLTAKDGFTMEGVPANVFSVAGASAKNSEDSGVIIAVFPATGDGSYMSGYIGALLYVAGGSFNNGVANMTVSQFHMSQYEIKGGPYGTVMGVKDPSYFLGVTGNPVESINWYSILVFCNKLSLLEGLDPIYYIKGSNNPAHWGLIPGTSNPDWDAVSADWDANGYRLPTEAEWEYAARGGKNADGYLYSGSNTIGLVAWYDENSENTTHTVGQKTPNGLGLHDMSGNVSELCWDWYAAYPVGSQVDYRGPSSGTSRVARGGAWSDPSAYSDVAYRSSRHPGYEGNVLGFRVVRR